MSDAAIVPLPVDGVSSVADKLESLKIETTAVQVEQYIPVSESNESVVPVGESTVAKVTGMISEIKTILNSPTKIPSLTKSQLSVDACIPPPVPVEKKATSPSFHLKRKSMSPTQKDQMSERLYAKAMELKQKRDSMYTQPLEECTFKPNILKPHGKSDGPPSVTSSNGPPSQDKDRFEMLHEQAKELARRKEEKKLSAEAQYSFKPEISKKSRRISSKLRMKKSAANGKASEESPPTTTNGSPRENKSACRFDELYAQHIELAARRKEKQLEMERKAAEECTFQPKIKKLKGKSPPQNRPLYDADREKQKRLEKEAKKTALEMAECTFRPAIARPKTADTKEEKSFFDRMQESEKKKEDRLEQLRREQDERKLKEATFCPKIKEIKTSKPIDEKKPFHERLFDKEYLLQQQAERERKKLEQEQFPFKPSIDTSSVNIPERHGSIFERLHDEGMKKQESLNLAEQERLKREMEECTFRPQVSIDLKDPPTEPVWERLSNDKKHILEERQRLKEELEAKECTFKPDLGGNRTPPSRRNTVVVSSDSPPPSGTSSIPKYRRQSSPTVDNMPIEHLDPTTTLWNLEDTNETASLVPPFPTSPDDEVSARSRNILDNYDSWAATLEEKMRELK